MRRMLITIAVLLAWTGAAFGAELVVKVPAEEYQQQKKQLEQLKKQVNALEQQIMGGATPVAPAASTGSVVSGGGDMSSPRMKNLDRDIAEIYDTLDEVETAALLDRINLGAEVRIRADNYRVKNYTPLYFDYFNPFSPTFGDWVFGTPIVDERNDSNWSSRFRINMDADVSRSIKFAARLALQKNWADSVGSFSHDNNRAHVASGDTTLKVDRFYVDWTPKFVLPIGVSFGRLPTSDGPPLEFKENRKRQSIYPALIFDGEPDGIVTTLGLEKIIGLRGAGIRYFYAMAVQYDNDQKSMNYMDSVVDDFYKDNRVQAIFFETELPGLRDSLLVLSYVPAKDILMANPATGAMANVGDITLMGAHLQMVDLFGLGLDIFGSYGENRNEPNGNTLLMGQIDTTAFGGPGIADFNMGLMGSTFGAAAANMASTDVTTGWAWYAGLRYEIPVRLLNRPKIGFEYNRGNKYWFSFTPGSSEIDNRLATRGEAYDAYYIQPFNKNLFLRIGGTKIVYEAMGSGMPIGEPMEYDNMQAERPEFYNYYAILESRF